jgi:hypothetical protein
VQLFFFREVKTRRKRGRFKWALFIKARAIEVPLSEAENSSLLRIKK